MPKKNIKATTVDIPMSIQENILTIKLIWLFDMINYFFRLYFIRISISEMDASSMVFTSLSIFDTR